MQEAYIQTKYGKVSGFSQDGCTKYLGIPFAAVPVGELAFKHPQPPEPWEGVLKAVKGSANPLQKNGTLSIGNNSQDCLYLNVFVPENVASPLPVMVWIYGGAFKHGGAGATKKDTAELQYDLARFAKETGCIVVSFNYRLNLYGFLNLHFLDDSFDRNNGLYDQIMALRFVNENIAAFGGNPNNITIFGQSAGAASILALMTMKEADGLFHKSIVQSACVEHFFTEEESETYTKMYLKIAGVTDVKQLLTLSEEAVYVANEKYSSWVLKKKGDVRCAFSPTIDGITLVDAPKNAVKKSNRPMLIGNVKQEGNLYTAPIHTLALPIMAKLLKLKVEKGTESYRQRLSNALTDHIFIRPQLEILKDYAGAAWRYRYHYFLPGNKMGCFHVSELPVLFGLNSLMGPVDDAESERVGAELRRIWSQFAKDGHLDWDNGTDGIVIE